MRFRELIRRRYANKETVAGAERRIEMIALDIAEHFNERAASQRLQGPGSCAQPRRRLALR